MIEPADLKEIADVPAQLLASGGLVDAIDFAGCLPGNAYAKLPIFLGKKIVVKADKSNDCDSRGWACSGSHDWVDPDGYGDKNWPDAGTACINAPVGMLVGAISTYNVQGNMTLKQWKQIFGGNGFAIGSQRYLLVSPFKGFLYLLMNDGPYYADNRGAIQINVRAEKFEV